jgi:hypothetical protein
MNKKGLTTPIVHCKLQHGLACCFVSNAQKCLTNREMINTNIYILRDIIVYKIFIFKNLAQLLIYTFVSTIFYFSTCETV